MRKPALDGTSTFVLPRMLWNCHENGTAFDVNSVGSISSLPAARALHYENATRTKIAHVLESRPGKSIRGNEVTRIPSVSFKNLADKNSGCLSG